MAGDRYVTTGSLAACTTRWLAAVRPWSRSRSLPPLEHAALIVVDLQRYFADPSSHAHLPALEAILTGTLELVTAFRAAGRPVVLTRHGRRVGDGQQPSMMQRWWRGELVRGEPGWALVEPLAATAAELIVDKEHYSAFHGTELGRWLEERGVETVVVAGVMTHLCCESTVRDAFMRGLAPVIVADATASVDETLHVGALRGLSHGFAVVASVPEMVAALGGALRIGADISPRAEPPPERVELAVVGAGPAGLAAAIQATRAGRQVWLTDRAAQGAGQLRCANLVENYPGFPGGVDGVRLMDRMLAQAEALGVRAWPSEVEAVEQLADQSPDLRLRLSGGRQVEARAVILATGTVPRALDQAQLPPGAPVVFRADAVGRVRGAEILVVGGGEVALDQAAWLSRRGAAAVHVAIRGSAPRALPLLVQRARERGVTLHTEARLAAVSPASPGPRWRATLERPDGRRTLVVDALVVCVGKLPALPVIPAAARAAPGQAPAVDRAGRSPVPGLYVVGDASRGILRQVAIAVGDGVAAAMHADRYLRGGRWEDGL